MTLWMVGRRTSAERPGGDAMQIAESAEVAREAGLDVVVEHDAGAVTPSAGDLVHFFGLQRAHDWGDLPERARAAGARLLVTPLWHPLERYHREGRRGLDGLAAKVVGPDRLAGLRWGRGGGVDGRAAEVLGLADLVLLAAEGEAALLPAAAAHATVVPVAIPATAPPSRVDGPGAETASDGDYVACVGRIEPLKNPAAVAVAASAAGLPVRFFGRPRSKRHAGYGRGLEAVELPYAEVRAALRRARVHVLASWTEVVGRATLEAALEGAAVVITDVGHAPDMLGRDTDGVFVVPPGDQPALQSALAAAWERGRSAPDAPLVRRVREHFTWDVVGPKLAAAWRSLA